MSDDYAKATSAPGFITINGKEYRVGKFGPRDLGDIEAWLKSQVPDPRLMARELCAGLPDAVAIEVWRDLSMEAANWPPSLETRQGNKLLTQTHEGHAILLYVALKKHNASFTLEMARHITADDQEIALVVSKMAQPEETFDPKSPAAVEMSPG